MLENTTDDDIIHANDDTIFKRVLQNDLILPGTNSLYYGGYLRVDSANNMKRKHFSEMVFKTLKTDYDVEEAEWWEKALAIVIVIISVFVGFIVTVFTGGNYAAGFLAMQLVLTVGMTVLAQFGGLSAQSLVKKIGAFAQIVGYAAIVAGLFNIYQAAADGVEEGTQGVMTTNAQVGHARTAKKKKKQSQPAKIAPTPKLLSKGTEPRNRREKEVKSLSNTSVLKHCKETKRSRGKKKTHPKKSADRPNYESVLKRREAYKELI